MAGPDARLRDDQETVAVAALCEPAARVLVVQATGWGKSAVYWAATAIRRSEGAGPTLVVSPLLSLMRDQVAAAARAGLRAATLNSSQHRRVVADRADAARRRPRRAAGLARAAGQPRLRPARARRPRRPARPARHRRGARGLRLGPRLPPRLPPRRPTCCSRSTRTRPCSRRPRPPTQRVTDDVAAQLGEATLVLRGPLARSSLELVGGDRPDPARALRLGGRPPARAARARASSTRSPSPTPSGSPRRSRTCTAPRCRSPPTPASSTPPSASGSRTPCATTRSRRSSRPRRSGMGYDKPDLGFVVHVGCAAVAGVLLPAGRPRRPRHRPRPLRAAARPTRTPACGTTSRPRRSPTPTRCAGCSAELRRREEPQSRAGAGGPVRAYAAGGSS